MLRTCAENVLDKLWSLFQTPGFTSCERKFVVFFARFVKPSDIHANVNRCLCFKMLLWANERASNKRTGLFMQILAKWLVDLIRLIFGNIKSRV